ncbi:MAG: NUDIX domain-containing protein, partial [Trebonia sp.]
MGKALLPHDEYVASLPRKRMAVAALIRDADDRALLVSPTYEGSWLVPGGVVDAGESPHAACRREVAEETGLSLVSRNGSRAAVSGATSGGRLGRPRRSGRSVARRDILTSARGASRRRAGRWTG